MGRFNIKKYYFRSSRKWIIGQSLVEILIALGIASILFVGAASGMALFLKGGYDTRTIQAATLLSSEYIDGLSSLAESNWNNLYYPPAAKGSGSQFYLMASGTAYSILAGSNSTAIEGRIYTRYFAIENVNRTACGTGNITASPTSTSCPGNFPGVSSDIADDPVTQKITIYINWPGSAGFNKVIYLSRISNSSFSQADWSSGSGQEYFATSSAGVIINNQFATSSIASSTGNTNAINFSTPGSISIQF